LGRIGHFLSAHAFIGSWVSGYLVIAANAWMQHPVGYSRAADGSFHLTDFWALLSNPWVFWQYVHNMGGAVITASFAMSALDAFYLLTRKDLDYGKLDRGFSL
jgi:cytochrome bd ubiquinol oxidase subunit I